MSCLKRVINKKIGYISPICPEAPRGRISTKFCTAVEVVDIITCEKFLAISLGRSILWGVENGGFPLTKPVAVNTGLRNCAACDNEFIANLLLNLPVQEF